MLPGKPTLITIDPENIKAILATQFNDFAKGKDFHDSWEYVASLAMTLTLVSRGRYIHCGWKGVVRVSCLAPPTVSETTPFRSTNFRKSCQ